MLKKVIAVLALVIVTGSSVPLAAHANVPEVTVGLSIAPADTVAVPMKGFALAETGQVAIPGGTAAALSPGSYRAVVENMSTTKTAFSLQSAPSTFGVQAANAAAGAHAEGRSNMVGEPDSGDWSVPVLAIWSAVGMLMLGAGMITVMTTVRRQQLPQD